MTQHQKPTKEELDEQINKSVAEAEDLKDKPEKDETEGDDKDETTELDAKPSEEGTTEEEVSDEDTKEAEPSKEVKEKLKEEVKEKDKKLSESAREAQKLLAKNRVVTRAIIDADEAPEPTEDELMAEYPDWDIMSDTEKGLAKETVISRRWRQTISKAKEQATKIEKWNDSVIAFVEDPQTLIDIPELEGKTDEFKEFATKEENNSVPFKLLMSAFLFEKSKGKIVHKGKMFEDGTGGSNERPQPKTNKISLEEARIIREQDYPKYKELLKAGKIDFNV